MAKFTSADCRRWLEEHFTPGRMVLFYYGPTEPDKVLSMAERFFKPFTRLDCQLDRVSPSVNAVFDRTNPTRDSYQAHTVVGTRIPGLFDPHRIDTALLVNIIGGPGMNSLLNVALRERYGLVYTIDAATSLMSDNGLLTVYFGCDPNDVTRCLRLIDRVVTPLAETPMSARRLDIAKRQFIGQLTVGSVNSEQMAISMGRSTLYRGYASSLEQTIEAVKAITPDNILSAAQVLNSTSRLTLM